MTRFVDSLNQTAAADEHLTLVEFAEFQFDSGTVRYTNAPFDIVWGGNTWTGAGEFGSVDKAEETKDLSPRAMRFKLSGLDPGSLQDALNEDYFNRTAIAYQGFMNKDQQLIADPEVVWSGRMDSMSIKLGQEFGEIVLTCEHILARGPAVTYWSDQDQKTRHSNDRIFDQLPFVDREIIWGGEVGHVGGRRESPEGAPENEILP